jgi:endoglucanase
MKNIFTLILISIISYSCQTKQAPVSNGSPEDFKIFKGTNIAHWLSQSKKRGAERENFFVEKDIMLIKELGFDHVRLAIDEEQMWEANGNRIEDAFQLMTNCLDWCAKHNLKAIVDLHILRSHYFNDIKPPLFNDPKEQEKFYSLWIDLSSVLKKYPVSDVAYEILNEPVAGDPEKWNILAANTIKRIREHEPQRIIVLGSNLWQSAATFDVLKVPNDKYIILSFHYYQPFFLTHHHASWTNLKDYNGPVHYPGALISKAEHDSLPEGLKNVSKEFIGTVWNIEAHEKYMKLAIQKSKELGLQLYCGEYGVIAGTPEDDRIRWYNDMITVFNKNNIASANWNYKSGSFGIINDEGLKNEAMIQAILKK